MITPPPPTHLSPEAAGYLLQPDVLAYPADWTDPAAVGAFRDIAHPLWCELNELIDFDFSATSDTIAGVPVERVNAGATKTARTLLHFHGGMYCAGTPEIDRVLNAQMAKATGVDVVSVDYRLAPEHVFPAAVDDALAVYAALVEEGCRVTIYGESAGGGLAAACALAARDAGLRPPDGLAMLSPMLDLTGGSDTYRTLAAVDPDYHDTSTLLRPAAAYAGSTPLDHPLISPLFANLAGLPPSLVQVGGREILLGDATRFARAARSAGVDVQLDVLDGGWHNYALWRGFPEADAAIDSLAAFLLRSTL